MPILIKSNGKNPTLQEKTVSAGTVKKLVTADDGYDGLSKVTVSAISSATQATPSISVSSSGLITASATQSEGYVSSGTKSATKQLTTQSGGTITPSTGSQLAVSSGRYTLGSIYVSGDSNLVADNIKNGVSIFGVTGSYEGGGGKVYLSTTTATPTSTTELVVSGLPTDAYTFFLVGTGGLTLRAAVAFYYNSNNKDLESFVATSTSKTSALSGASSYFSAAFSSGTLTINATKSYYTFSTGTTFSVYCLSGAPVYNIEIPVEVES